MAQAHRDRLTRPMELIGTTAGTVTVAEAPRGKRLFLDVDDTGRLLERCFSLGAQCALLYAPNLSSTFFDLSSGEAGEVLQRLRNFRLRLAVVYPSAWERQVQQPIRRDARRGAVQPSVRRVRHARRRAQWLSK